MTSRRLAGEDEKRRATRWLVKEVEEKQRTRDQLGNGERFGSGMTDQTWMRLLHETPLSVSA